MVSVGGWAYAGVESNQSNRPYQESKWTPTELNYSRFTYSTHSRPIRPCIRAFRCRKALFQCTRRYRTRVFLPDRLARRFWKLEALFWALKGEKKRKTPVRQERYGKQQEKDIRKMSKDRLSAAMLCFSTRHTQASGGKGSRTKKFLCCLWDFYELSLCFFVFIPTNVTSHHRQVFARSPCSYFFLRSTACFPFTRIVIMVQFRIYVLLRKTVMLALVECMSTHQRNRATTTDYLLFSSIFECFDCFHVVINGCQERKRWDVEWEKEAENLMKFQ